MTLLAKTGAFDTGTGAVGTTVTLSGFGFSPKLVIFFTAGTTGGAAPGVVGQSLRRALGFAATATQRAGAGGFSLDGAATSSCSGIAAFDQALIWPAPSAAYDG